jgi:hypothetical protein
MTAMNDLPEAPAERKEIDREALENEAERARARLLTTLDVLDRRRHDALDVRHQVETHIVPIVSVGAVVAVSAAGAVAIAIYRSVDAKTHRPRERVRAFTRLWRHPERAGRVASRSLFGEVARKVVLAVASMIAVELAKRYVHRIMAALPDAEHPAPDRARELPTGVTVSEERLRPRVEPH